MLRSRPLVEATGGGPGGEPQRARDDGGWGIGGDGKSGLARELFAVSVVKAGTSRRSVVQSVLVALARQLRQALVEGDSVIALGLVGLVLLLVQNATPNIIGIDGYYHIKLAWLMHQDGFHPRMDFPWLPLTVLNPEDFTNHHLLYHLALIPFTFGDLRLGAKAAALVYASLAILATYLLMTRLKVRYPLFWLLALLGSAEWFLGRLSMTRRQSLSLLLLMVATYLLIQGRYRWMLVAAFAYAWLFDGFVLLIAVVGLAFGARLVADRRWAWPMLGWTSLGLALALLLNPYYPNNITFTIVHVLPKLVPPADIQVGNEWSPYSPDVLLRTSWLAVAFVPAGLLPLLLQPRRALRDRTVLFLLGLALLFLVLYVKSRRFVEIEPAFAALLCSYTWVHYGFLRTRLAAIDWLPRLLRAGLALVAVVLLGWQLQQTVWRAQGNVSGGVTPGRLFRSQRNWWSSALSPGTEFSRQTGTTFRRCSSMTATTRTLLGWTPPTCTWRTHSCTCSGAASVVVRWRCQPS